MPGLGKSGISRIKDFRSDNGLVLLRAKRTQLLHGGFVLFNSTHLGVKRSAVEACSQYIELIVGPHRIDLNAAIVLIAHPAAQADFIRVLFDEPAEADALNRSVDEPAACFRHLPGSF